MTFATTALLAAGILSGGAETAVERATTGEVEAAGVESAATADFVMVDPRVPVVIRELRETGMNDQTPVVIVEAAASNAKPAPTRDDAGTASPAPETTPNSIAAAAARTESQPDPMPISERWIITWGSSQEEHAQGTTLTSGDEVPSSAFFYLVAPDGSSRPDEVTSVYWQTDLDAGYDDNGYPWRWVISNAPAGTHWIQATVNGTEIIRLSFQVGGTAAAVAASPPTTTAPAPPPESSPPTTTAPPEESGPPPSADPPQPAPAQTTQVGPGFHSTTLNARGANNHFRLAIPWTAPRDGVVTAFATYWVHGPEGAYFEGDGGINVISLRPDNGGQPDATVLGQLRIDRPCGAGGAFLPCGSWDHSNTLNFFPLATPGTVEAGRQYWWHIENVHPDPINNWTGIDGLSDATGPYDSRPQMYVNDGSGWRPATNAHLGKKRVNSPRWPSGWIDYTNSTFAPSYAVKYADGSMSSQSPYAEASDALSEWGNGTSIFQRVRLPAGVLQEVWLHAEHLSGSDEITLTVGGSTYTANGNGWIKFTPSISVSRGLTTLEFGSTGNWRTRGQWRYWGAPDWGGGAHHGAVGNKWDIWGGPQNADLPFLASVRTS